MTRDNSDEARARAEAKFRKQEHMKRESEKVWAEQAASDKADDAKRAQLKARRLAKEAADLAPGQAVPVAPKPGSKRPRRGP